MLTFAKATGQLLEVQRVSDGALLPDLHFLLRMVGGGDPLPGMRSTPGLVSTAPRACARCVVEDFDDRCLSGVPI
jgi:hypothetical protein